MRYLRYVGCSFRMSLYRAIEYRTGVLIQYGVDLIWYLVQFSLLRTVYDYVPQVGGYSLEQCYLFLGFVFATDAVNMVLFDGGIEHFTRSIRGGGLDYYLLKPMSPLYQLSISRVSLAGILNVFFSIGFWIFILLKFDTHYPWERWCWAWGLFINGVAINITFRLIVACLSFWTLEGGALGWLLHELLRFGNKPEAIYNRTIRFVLSSIVPVLLLSAWPCLLLVRETSPMEKCGPFAVTAVLSLILVVAWKRGVHRYEGIAFMA